MALQDPNFLLYHRRPGKVLRMQCTAFWEQSLAALVIYTLSLVAAALLVNLDHGWKYGDKVVLNNVEFNWNLAAILVMGFISVGLFKAFECYNRHLLDQDTDPSVQETNLPWGEVFCQVLPQVLRGIFLMLALIVAPFFLVNILTHHDAKRDYIYISVIKENSSHIIQV